MTAAAQAKAGNTSHRHPVRWCFRVCRALPPHFPRCSLRRSLLRALSLPLSILPLVSFFVESAVGDLVAASILRAREARESTGIREKKASRDQVTMVKPLSWAYIAAKVRTSLSPFSLALAVARSLARSYTRTHILLSLSLLSLSLFLAFFPRRACIKGSMLATVQADGVGVSVSNSRKLTSACSGEHHNPPLLSEVRSHWS